MCHLVYEFVGVIHQFFHYSLVNDLNIELEKLLMAGANLMNYQEYLDDFHESFIFCSNLTGANSS